MKQNLKVFLFCFLLMGWAFFIFLRYVSDNPPLPLYLSEFTLLGFILLLAFLIGWGLLVRLGFQEVFNLLFFLFALALGFGAIALFVLMIGQFKLLYTELFIGLSFLIIFLAKSLLARLIRQIYITSCFLKSMISEPHWFLLFPMIFIVLIHALAPPVFFDTLVYHLGLPNLYLQDHKVSVYPYIIYSYYPLNMEMLYTFGLLLYKSPILPNLLNFGIGVLTALSIYELSRRFFNKKVGFVALLVYYSTPMVPLLSTVTKNDLLLAYFEILALLGLLLWFEKTKGEPGSHENHRYLVLAAIFCGLAIGTKYIAGYFFITVCLLVLLRTWHQIPILSLLRFCFITGLVASPWLIRNLISTGNPFYPAFSAIFGTGKFLKPGLSEVTMVGFNRDPLSFIRLPWDMTFHPFEFGTLPFVGPTFLVFLPVLFWIAINRNDSEEDSHPAKLLGWFCLLLFIFWAVTFPTTRFYLTGIAILSVLIARFMVDLWNGKDVGALPFMRYLVTFVLGLIILHNLYLFVYLESRVVNPLPVALNFQSRKDYLSSQVDYYPAAQFINTTLPIDTKILLLGETRSYYINRPVLLSTGYNTTLIVDWINVSESVSDLLAKLKNLGITHILFNAREAKRLDEGYTYFNFPGQREQAIYTEFTKNHLQQLFSKNEVSVFEVKY